MGEPGKKSYLGVSGLICVRLGIIMWTLLGNIRDRKPDIVCSFCPFVSSFYCMPSPVRWQRPRVNKKFATLPPSPNPIEPLERYTPHCKPPPTFRRPIPLHTHTRLWKHDITLLLYWGMTGGSGVNPQLPRWARGVSARDPRTPQTSTQTRDWHPEGKSMKFLFLEGGKKK